MDSNISTSQLAEEIQDLFESVELRLQKSAKRAQRLDEVLETYRDRLKLTPFSTAEEAALIASARAKIAEAYQDIVTLHNLAAKQDPRPQPRDGGGK